MERNKEQDIRAWAKETIRHFQEAQDHAQVYFSGALFNSFIENIVKNSDGNPILIEIKFKYYLRFLDMGVGKGRSLASGKAKPNTALYSKIKANRVKKLAEMLAKTFGIEAVGLIETNLNDFNYEI